MKIRVGKLHLEIDYFGILLITVLLIADTTGWLMYALLACAIHELGHSAVIFMRSGHLIRLRLCAWGMELQPSESPPSVVWDACVSAAGPLANLLCAVLIWRFSLVASVLQLGCGLFNLLPIEGMDGGDLLHILLSHFFGDTAVYWTETTVTLTVGVVGCCAGVSLVLQEKNPTLLLATGYVVGLSVWKKIRSRKFFCS